MIDILRQPDEIRVLCDEENRDADVRIEPRGRKLFVWLTATESRPQTIELRWYIPLPATLHLLGDKWERAYANMEWCPPDGRCMPWYFLARQGDDTVGCGVMTQPGSFVSFFCDTAGITARFDVRCGGRGVQLDSRTLLAGVIVNERYTGCSAFAAAKHFCAVMCERPLLPRRPVYGSNNWYYAYGESSFEEIMEDARLLARLTAGNPAPPFMVIDDGWQRNRCDGPWLPNDKFGDMTVVAAGFRALGVQAGLWLRPLHDSALEQQHPDWCVWHGDKRGGLDPTHPEVQAHLWEVIATVKGWGFSLIKHDFTTFDLFGDFGDRLGDSITNYTGWSFYDTTRTSAEIVRDLYRLIREAAGDDVCIIGCNTVGHLCAGLCEIQRVGTDISGREWAVTRNNGVNALAFRLCQNDTFFKVDADCVGILGDHIDWRLNRQWLDLVANSGSPLFVSMQPAAVTEDIAADIRAAFAANARQCDTAEPLDWMETRLPRRWCINGEVCTYDWDMA